MKSSHESSRFRYSEWDLRSTEPSEVDQAWLWGIRQSAHLVGAGLGVPVTDVRLTSKDYAAAPEDMELSPSGLKVAKGTPAGVRWTYTAYTGDVPFFELVNEQTVRLGLGEGWRAAVHPDDRARVVALLAPGSDAPGELVCEYRVRLPDDAPRFVELHAHARRDGAGAISGWIGACFEVTSRRLAYEAAHPAQEAT